jgi:hypothetical protein
MQLENLFLQNLSWLRVLTLEIFGADALAKTDNIVKIIYRLMLMKFTHYGWTYSVWEFLLGFMVLGNIVPLYSWQVAQKIRARFLRTKNSQRRKLDAKEVLQATAITMHGQQRVLAVVERVINNYSLNITTQNSEKVTFETRHQFPTIEALSQFLEEKTILRLADFKSI